MKDKLIAIALLSMLTFGQAQADDSSSNEEYYARIYAMFCEGKKSSYKKQACEVIFLRMLQPAIKDDFLRTNRENNLKRLKKAYDILD